MSGFSQSHSIFTRNGGKKADVLGLKDHKPQSETLYSLGQDRQQDLDPAASKTPTIETNQSSAPMNLPHHSRHPALCLFTVAWILFFVFFLLPWQLLNDRPGWNLTRSISHDFTHCKEALNSFVKAPATTTTTIYVPAPIPTHVPNTESEVKMTTEQTFIAIKPDGVQRGLIAPIISRFENRGYKLVAIKLVTPGKEHLETHYADLKEKPFFKGLVEYMNSGPICAMVWEGRDAVKTGRTLLGATNPLASAPGTIRGDYSIDVGRNICHGSDSVENAKKEIALWFKDGEVVSWKSASFDWVYEKP